MCASTRARARARQPGQEASDSIGFTSRRVAGVATVAALRCLTRPSAGGPRDVAQFGLGRRSGGPEIPGSNPGIPTTSPVPLPLPGGPGGSRTCPTPVATAPAWLTVWSPTVHRARHTTTARTADRTVWSPTVHHGRHTTTEPSMTRPPVHRDMAAVTDGPARRATVVIVVVIVRWAAACADTYHRSLVHTSSPSSEG